MPAISVPAVDWCSDRGEWTRPAPAVRDEALRGQALRDLNSPTSFLSPGTFLFAQTVIATLPIFCCASTYRYASTMASSG